MQSTQPRCHERKSIKMAAKITNYNNNNIVEKKGSKKANKNKPCSVEEENDYHQMFWHQPSSSEEYSDCVSDIVPGIPSYPLHEAVFNNDVDAILSILKDDNLGKENICRKDIHGNTPLHLACMMGRSIDILGALLEKGATVETKNLQRWSPFFEAVSYGNRDAIKLLTKQLREDVYDALHKNDLSESLSKIRDCRLVLKWEFQSWIPFVTKVLPSDICVINKKGNLIRIDTKLLDCELLSWKHGDSYLLYSNKYKKKWVLVDNKTQKYQPLDTQVVVRDIEDKVDDFMTTDLIDIELMSDDVHLSRSTSGWIWKEDKIEQIGNYKSSIYNFNNVVLVTRKRREHLSDEDLKRNKAAYKGVIDVLKFGTFKRNNNDSNESENDDNETIDEDEEIQHRESLSPPSETRITWQEYITSKPGEYSTLGREHKIKTVKKAFKATVAVSQEFPMSKSDLLKLLSIIPLKHFKKLSEFVELKLPDGFPVRLDIPIFPFLSARITFEDFAYLDETADSKLFIIPSNYREDPNLLASLTGKFRGQRQ